MRVQTVTTLLPNSAEPHKAVFVRNLLEALSAECDLAPPIAPLAYAPPWPKRPAWSALRRVASEESLGRMRVLHPRYLVIPRVDALSGASYFAAILPLLRRLQQSSGPLLLHAHFVYPDAVGVALAARALRLPFVVTAHGSDVNVYAQRPSLRGQVRWALTQANAVIAVSKDIESKLRELTRGGCRRLVCIPCAGYDARVFHPREKHALRAELGLPPNGRVVAFVGQLVPVKGVEYLLAAWARFRASDAAREDDRLLIMGAGRLDSELQRRSAQLHITASVSFSGALPQTEVARRIAACDALCLPSFSEGTPNVVVEALASGVPVVASCVGGVPQLVRDGSNGYLVEPANAAALTAALTRALSTSWNANAISESVAHLSWAAIAEQNLALLRDVMQPSR